MKQIELSGVVGWDITAREIRDKLRYAGGEEVELLISSPGGSVYEALAIFNAIRDYKRDGKKINARIVGLAASAATYIPMAASSVTVEDNAIWMIHNPFALAMGDQRVMRKMEQTLNGIAGVIAAAYVAKTGRANADIREMMDNETYLFGEQIVEAGFADEVVPAGDGAENEDEARAMAVMAVDEMHKKLREEPERQGLDQVAALLPEIANSHKPVVDRKPDEGETQPANQAGNEREVPMTLEQLRMEHPAIDAYGNEREEAGVKKERERWSELHAQLEADPDNPKLAEVVNQAILSGKTLAQSQTAINVAIRDGRQLDGENPPVVATAPDSGPSLSDEDMQAAKMMGMSIEEYIKYSGGNQ